MKLPGTMTAEVLGNVGRRPATVLYPGVQAKIPRDYRGKIVFIPERCSGCGLCERDCPAEAIRIRKVGEKRFEAVFHLDHCLYCAQCVESCNRDALQSSPEFELAAIDRSSLLTVYAPKPLTDGSSQAAARSDAPAPR